MIDRGETEHLFVAVHRIGTRLVEPQFRLLDLQLRQMRHRVRRQRVRVISIDHPPELVAVDLQAKVQVLLQRRCGRRVVALEDVIAVHWNEQEKRKRRLL